MNNQTPIIVQNDPWLLPYAGIIRKRQERTGEKEKELIINSGKLSDFAAGYLYFGLHRTSDGWIFREWAPNATKIYLVGDFNEWKEQEDYQLTRKDNGQWEIYLPENAIEHQQHYKLLIYWNGGKGYRIPSYVNRVIQHKDTKVFDAQVWRPERPFTWINQSPVTLNFHPRDACWNGY